VTGERGPDPVQYRQLGDSGLTVSVVGLGANNFGGRLDQQQTTTVINAAIEAGITHIDTAEVYGGGGASERMIGEALKGHQRDKVVLATKFGHQSTSPGSAPGSRRNVRRAVEGSLTRLQTDYIDLYYLHFPDPVTPIAETLTALTELINEGKVRYIATCNLTAWQVVEAEWTARTARTARFIASQNKYSLIDREAEQELLPACRQYGVGLVPYFPLAQGLLTGKFKRGEPAPEGTRLSARIDSIPSSTFDKVEALERFAAERGLSLLQVAIGGLAAQPGVSSVIAGATKPEQIAANVAAADWVPSAEDLAALNALQ
jgi:aryl-alcohol dehydrogenase-like predicted oxidoreductase